LSFLCGPRRPSQFRINGTDGRNAVRDRPGNRPQATDESLFPTHCPALARRRTGQSSAAHRAYPTPETNPTEHFRFEPSHVQRVQ